MWTRWVAPLNEINKVLRRLLSGDSAARVSYSSAGRLDRMGEKINKLADLFESNLKELGQDRARLLTVLTNMIEAVVAVDTQGRIIVANRTFAHLFGVDLDAVGKPLLEIVRHSELNSLVERILKDKSAALNEIATWNPEEKIFEAHGVPLMEDGSLAGALIVLHDITRIRRLEQTRKDFVANVSHELRTPLASIKGFAETLLDGAIDNEKNRLSFLKSIEMQADRMTKLVDDLLDLAAIESGKRAPAKESLDIMAAIVEVIEVLKPLAARKTVSLIFTQNKNVPAVPCDRNQIKQVLTNLLENAIKFNREGGSVFINAITSPTSITIAIKDTGPGIPAEDLPRLFERFYRVDKARSREMGGTGLGLAIVKHIVEAHGGSVSVERSPNQGSVFSFSLPIH